ncbi:FMN-dependent NADH-azoreductase [Silvimonas amylolytica]|uniref:FMN dependent NADH:quinone oxidoreductase n=1 Tax=Silvimonas amylolytica TaxID=449663 RepID=A0ABQ2PPV5_9NEIS|nr:FMN-dependent NADH-azoreductase [Silvimonas amylolytica]GGP27279.1 FMN-dependent NADH-azoreductase [Silvimonas amylolytica]
MKLLHIDSSVLGDNSVSRKLTANITKAYQAANPTAQVEYLDLAVSEPSHLSGEALGHRFVPADSHTEVQKREAAYGEALLSQFLAADVIVVGAPMYNFSIPSQLKSWIDRIAVAGRTFKYTENGPVGLATGKTVVVASSRGGVYSSNEALRALDHQEAYLRTVFGFVGITDVRFVRAEGVSQGDAKKAEAFANAEKEIAALTA